MQIPDYQLTNKVKFLQKKKGVSFSDLCDAVKMTPAGLRGTLEKGSSVKIELLVSLAHYFSVGIDYFINEAEEKITLPEEKINQPENHYLRDKINKIEDYFMQEISMKNQLIERQDKLLESKEKQFGELLNNYTKLVNQGFGKKDNSAPFSPSVTKLRKNNSNLIKVDFNKNLNEKKEAI